MDAAIALVIIISSVDNTVQTLEFVVRKFGQKFEFGAKNMLNCAENVQSWSSI